MSLLAPPIKLGGRGGGRRPAGRRPGRLTAEAPAAKSDRMRTFLAMSVALTLLLAPGPWPGSSLARAADVTELSEGSQVPDVGGPTQDGKELRLRELRGKFVVLYFYPKDDTPGCTKQACNFRDSGAAYKSLGAGTTPAAAPAAATPPAATP